MQLLSLFLLAVSAGALPPSRTPPLSEALAPTTTDTPVNSTSPQILEKRSLPWIGNFDNQGCHHSHVGHERPKIAGQTCTPFIPSSSYVNIFWGNGWDTINGLYLYSDDECHNLNATLKRSGDWTCFAASAYTVKTVLGFE